MKTNNKLQDLILEGFSIDTIGNLTESQLNAIHKRVVKEQRTPVKLHGSKLGPVNTAAIASDLNKKGVPVDVTERQGKKRKSKNPWAICTSSLSDEFGTSERSEWTKSQMKKYERCVMDVKKSMKEGRNPYEPIIESKIIEIVKNNIQPRMTKKDFVKTLIERNEKETTTVPEKEKVVPTKPNRRVNPFKNPNPGTKEKPRGKAEKMKSDFINLLKKTIG